MVNLDASGTMYKRVRFNCIATYLVIFPFSAQKKWGHVTSSKLGKVFVCIPPCSHVTSFEHISWYLSGLISILTTWPGRIEFEPKQCPKKEKEKSSWDLE